MARKAKPQRPGLKCDILSSSPCQLNMPDVLQEQTRLGGDLLRTFSNGQLFAQSQVNYLDDSLLPSTPHPQHTAVGRCALVPGNGEAPITLRAAWHTGERETIPPPPLVLTGFTFPAGLFPDRL
ncbi:long-chain specific acyl-CoA dehydrogenase, mitochondrial [Platysternon megacephalum]|uniref:Long-chain specific acyl-CoA dehydrogenase, mitochondrial n=1 Tax=Platysternon megacephalum TaxID=55544 RepID=A0A4D9ETE3_9SAUR|nr:long-chain specific acyl-CoA dehydrogenase, mitochondrial [Platysternon megacephalum]